MEIYKRVGRTLIKKGAILDYYQDQVQIPGGVVADWDFIDHKGAAAVLPVLPDGRIIMVRQYRNALDRETIEIPAGGLNGREEPTIHAAARELEEETGYFCDSLEFLLSVRTTVAFCNEKIDIYLARDLRPGVQHLDEDEFLDVAVYTLEDLYRKIMAGEIQDGKTVSALLAYKTLLSENQK